MPSPISDGRMIRKDIRKSKGIASLSPEAAVLFFCIIPHLNSHGKMNGEPNFIKGECVPLIPYLTVEKIEKYLKEIHFRTHVKWFKLQGLRYLHALNWSQHQKLDLKKVGKDDLPSYKPVKSNSTPEVVQEYSKSTPELVPHEREEEVKEKDKDKDKVKDEVKEEVKGKSIPLSGSTPKGFNGRVLEYIKTTEPLNKCKEPDKFTAMICSAYDPVWILNELKNLVVHCAVKRDYFEKQLKEDDWNSTVARWLKRGQENDEKKHGVKGLANSIGKSR